MSSNQFGRGRVPTQQQRLDAGSFRQASVMTGSLPVTPARESFRPSDRPVSPGAIPNRAGANQRFFSSSVRTGTPQAARPQSGFNRVGNPGASVQMARPSQGNTQTQRTFTPPSSQRAPSTQSTRPGWRTFNPPSGQSQPYGGTRNSGGQVVGQSRPNFSPPAESPRQFQNYSRGSARSIGYTRPPLNLQQPIVTPRRGSYSSPSPRGGSRGGSSSSSGRASSEHNRR